MIDQGLIGKESPPVKNVIEKIALQRFVEAIGETNPIYFDEEYAKSTRYGSIIAPPTFCRTLNFGAIPGFLMPREGVIHGEQSFTYYKPLKPGDVVYCRSRLADIQEKEGRSGRMIFVITEQEGRDGNGELFFTCSQIGIVRKEALEREKKLQEEDEQKIEIPIPAVSPRFSQLQSGDTMEPVEMPPITKTQLVKYSGASGDFNPIHTVDEVAREMGLGGVIAHGMLTMALLGRFLTGWMGPDGTLDSWGVRFAAMVRPGDVIKFQGRIKSKEPGDSGGLVHCEVWGENTRGETVIKGTASIRLP
jgi:acyl dehydratase